MIISSLLDISLSERDLDNVIKSLNLDLSFKIERVIRKGISSTKLIVEENKVERSFKEVKELVKNSNLDEKVKENAINIFKELAIAEAKVHNKEYNDVIFHEVGSDDAVFDITASTLGILRLKEKGYRIFSTPVNLGGGEVRMHHGIYPVPPPAVLEVLKDSKVEIFYGEQSDGELLTPTGATILAYFSEGNFKQPFKVKRVSYGAGNKETDKPNVLRLILGEAEFHDRIVLIETNIDDASGEILGNVMNLLAQKAYDVAAVPYFGKKNRPGYILRAICDFESSEEVSRTLMEETGTIGVRIIPVYHRVYSPREEAVVEVLIEGKKFKIRVKRSYPGFQIIKPEFDDVKKISEELSIPLPVAYREVMKFLDRVIDGS